MTNFHPLVSTMTQLKYPIILRWTPWYLRCRSSGKAHCSSTPWPPSEARRLTRDIANDAAIMDRLRFDPARQLLGAQCSGTLLLAKLNLLNAIPACTDLNTKPWVQESGVKVLNQSFYAEGNIATAGGCLASQYLAAWIIARLVGKEAAESAIHYVAPVGEKETYVERANAQIAKYLPSLPNAAATAEACKQLCRVAE